MCYGSIRGNEVNVKTNNQFGAIKFKAVNLHCPLRYLTAQVKAVIVWFWFWFIEQLATYVKNHYNIIYYNVGLLGNVLGCGTHSTK